MNANRIRVKSSRISPASLLTWTEFREKDVSFIVQSEIISYKLIKQQLRVQKPSVCIVADVSRAGLLAAALDRFLVFGIFTNLAIIKDKVIKMFSLLRVM